ncbi:MAG: very short patch repair endonuclease [Kiritimatiellia bacterium]
MTDTLTIEERSRLMAKIKGKDTGPERAVRSLLHRAGYRFRKHVPDLPGKPDVVLPKYKTVVFVHGCFWHRHKNCKIATTPKSHRKFWADKFARNVANDRKHLRQLRRRGWKVVTVWACQLKRPERVRARIEKALRPAPRFHARPPASPLPKVAESRPVYGSNGKEPSGSR